MRGRAHDRVRVTPLASLRLAGWIAVAAALLSAGWAGAWHWRGVEVEHLRGELDRAQDAVTALGGQISEQNARIEQWLRAGAEAQDRAAKALAEARRGGDSTRAAIDALAGRIAAAAPSATCADAVAEVRAGLGQ